jgi:hypothetical protein
MTAHVCPPDHRHGDASTCYRNHGCRCFPCRVTHARYQGNRTRQIAYGRWDAGLVDATPVREHLVYLSSCGIGYGRVAELAGVSRTSLAKVLRGSQGGTEGGQQSPRRIARESAEKVLAVRADFGSVADGALVSSRGARRRIEALGARGWSKSRVAHELGWTPGNLHKIFERDHVSAGTHRALDALYNQLATTRPPTSTVAERIAVSRTLNTAAAQGWAPPLAWDDIDQDPHPPEVPTDVELLDEHALENALAGVVTALTDPERDEAVRRFTTAGLSAREIGDRLGITGRTVTRIRSRLGVEGAA